DVINGIDRAEERTYDLINNINEEMNSVSDIISLAPLNMDEFSHYANKGREHSTKVVEELHELDYQQTKALEGVDEDLRLLQNYLNEMNITYGNSSAIPNFSPLSAFEMPTYKKVKEKVFGRRDPLHHVDTSNVRMFEDINTYKGIGLGIYDIVKDLGEGIYELHNKPHVVLYHLLLFLGNARFRPVDTSLYISKALTDSYIKNVVKGDNESKARWFT